MKACGLIVEYNPLHHGHVYHLQQSKQLSNADCLIAVMSGNFLQRGEPAIVDKFHRARAALSVGIDIVLELPYAYAVQSSEWFAKGAVHTLHAMGVSTICFGSESGKIEGFIKSYQQLESHELDYQQALKQFLSEGHSFPKASELAKQKLKITTDIDFTKPNNILGFSYVKTILQDQLPIIPLTIKRIANDYHDETITGKITSATSIRKELLRHSHIPSNIVYTIPEIMLKQLQSYQNVTKLFHTWEHYFPFIRYRVLSMDKNELANITGMEEGLEYRIIETAKTATSMKEWFNQLKTKRYTYTRLQRLFVHLLTHVKKTELEFIHTEQTVPYIRLLGITNRGQQYLNKYKKDIALPMVTSFQKKQHPLLNIEERASRAYYSILQPSISQQMFQQEINKKLLMI